MQNLGSSTEVRLLLGISKEELTDTEIKQYLLMANKELVSRFSTSYFDYCRAGSVRDDGVMKVKLYFTPLGDIQRVLVNDTILSSDEYSLSGDVVSITTNLNTNDEIYTYYVPEILDTLVNYICCRIILSNKILVTTDNDMYKNIITAYNEIIQDIIKNMHRRPMSIGWYEGNK